MVLLPDAPLTTFKKENKTYTDFIFDMRTYGLIPNGPFNAKSGVNRATDTNKSSKNDDGWYVYNELYDISFGAYGSWLGGKETVKWCSKAENAMTFEQRQEYNTFQQQAIQKRENDQKQAQEKAIRLTESLPLASNDHPYLLKKKVKAHGIYQHGEDLLIPAYNEAGEVQTYQSIPLEGVKKFMSQGKAQGTFFKIDGNPDTVLLCEGYATGASLYEATGSTVYCAFGSGNLLPVAKIIRKQTNKQIIICADNDRWVFKRDSRPANIDPKAIPGDDPRWTEWNNLGYLENPGVIYAEKVKEQLTNVTVIKPDFYDIKNKPTDFNDLFCQTNSFEPIRQYFKDQLKPSNAPAPLFYIKATDVEPSIEANDFVQGLLSDGGLSVVYGQSNCGKTFFTSDLALHVALGAKWRDKRIEKGAVIYVALEGASGLKNRLAAFKEHYKIIPENFAMVPCQVNFLDPKGNISEFIQLLHQANDEFGSIKLIVIDTLARAMSGGDENTPSDMGMLVHHADRIRLETGAHVCFVHHSGKDQAKGARGHSSLRAAVDTEIEITREDGASYSTVKIAKQREMSMGEDMQFSLKVIDLGRNKHLEMVTSCIVEACEIQKSVKREVNMSAKQEFMYDAILFTVSEEGVERNVSRLYGTQKCITYDQLRTCLEDRGYRDLYGKGDDEKVKSATQAAREAIKKMGKVNFNSKYLWLTFKD